MSILNIGSNYHSSVEDPNGSGGASGTAITPEVQAMIDKQINDQVTGLKAKNSELLGKLKEQTDNLKRFEGIDPEQVKGILQRFENDEEAKLIAEGKIDEVINKRTERLRHDVEKKLQSEKRRAEKAEEFANKFRSRVLGDEIRAAASQSGALASAQEDLLLRAKGIFKINDEGQAVAVDEENNPIMGKDGRTPLTPAEWIDSLKESAPHLFPSASGTGAGNSKSGGAQFKRSQMSSADKAAYIRRFGREAYLGLPK
ncbi:hypothetical protein [Arsenophonus sp.]|uniref:hypothetical protein n=1 Tax=Arsenophonus sp. TaxID=1872640 RepID=UPI00286524E1|nr:hypothetical protein [Arsenophonus sp.]MDR5616842.1 hypothetical protein [Arsenophonus sp.]